MKKIIIAILCAFHFIASAQQQFTAPVPHWSGAPIGTPSTQGARVRYDQTAGKWYFWNGSTWLLQPDGVAQVSGLLPPAYTPGVGQSQFAINAANELYRWRTGTTWDCINCGGAVEPDKQILYGTGTGTDSDANFLRDVTNNDVQILGSNANLSVQTTDTNATLSIYNNPIQRIRNTVLSYGDVTNSGGGRILTFQPLSQTNNPGVGSFNFVCENNIVDNLPYSTRPNHIWMMGYNVNPGGGRQIQTDANLHISYESSYNLHAAQQGLPVGKRVWEWHLQAGDTVSNIAHRVITAVGAHDGSAGSIGFCSDGVYYSRYNSPTNNWLSANYRNKEWVYNDSMPIFFAKNGLGAGGFYQRNFANSSYLSLAYADNLDRIVLGGSGVASSYMPHGVLELGSNAEILGEFNILKIGRITKPTNLRVFGGGTESLWLQSEAGGSDIYKFQVNSDNLGLLNPAGSPVFQVYDGAIGNIIIANNRWGFGMSPGARWSLKQSSNAAGGGFQIQNLSGSHDFYFNLDANGAFRFFNTSAGERFAVQQDGTLSFGATKRQVFSSTATPEAVITASPGDIVLTNESGTGKAYIKRTGTGNTGHSELQQKADAYVPLQKTDAAAANGELYYSTTQNKLCYKDPGGTVNPLY